MFNGITASRYYLFSISNLLAAFGGGLILGKATDVIIHPIFHGGSILAFFIGSVLGLVLLQLIPKKNTAFVTQTFSIGCGLVSLMMYLTYLLTSTDGLISGFSASFFFALLTIRFSLWFFSRVKRASESSGKEQSIAWVEFGYYFGMVLGLVLWDLIGLTISLGFALILDAVLQFCAGTLDIKGFLIKYSMKNNTSHPANSKIIKSENFNLRWCKKMAFSVIALTVGVQVIIFHIAHLAPSTLTPYILAVFYFGVATSAFICNKLKVFLSWDNNEFTLISARIYNRTHSLGLLPLISIAAIFVLCTIVKLDNLYVDRIDFTLFLSIFIAAFFYEVLSLSLLDRIGYEASQSNTQNIIMKTYGLMGVCSAIAFWLLISFKTNLLFTITLLGLCTTMTTFAIIKRTHIGQISSSATT